MQLLHIPERLTGVPFEQTKELVMSETVHLVKSVCYTASLLFLNRH